VFLEAGGCSLLQVLTVTVVLAAKQEGFRMYFGRVRLYQYSNKRNVGSDTAMYYAVGSLRYTFKNKTGL